MTDYSQLLVDHRLALNVAKTKLMFFGMNAKANSVQTDMMHFSGGDVEVVREFKYLGMLLDNRLRFDKHANYIRSKIIPKMKTLGKIRRFVSKSTTLYLYGCLVKPVFEYNDFIYDPVTIDDTQSLEVLQNNCLRICLNCDHLTSRTELYRESGFCSLARSREEHSAKMVYLGLNNKSTTAVNKMFCKVSEMHDRTTRSNTKNEAYVPSHWLECCKGNLKIRGTNYFNKLPE